MRRKPCQVNVTDSGCGAIEHSSESTVINVYRQFLITANANADLHRFKQEILRAISRVFGGVSAIIDFEIMGLLNSIIDFLSTFKLNMVVDHVVYVFQIYDDLMT